MITITDKLRQVLERRFFNVLYGELLRIFLAAADQVMIIGTVYDPYSSFNLELLIAEQLYSIGVVGLYILSQLSSRSYSASLFRWNRDVRMAMYSGNMEVAKGIDKWARGQIGKIIDDGVANALSKEEISSRIRVVGRQISATRAGRISTTEATRSASIGMMLAANDYPYEMDKHWVNQDDARVRVSPFSHHFNIDLGIPLGAAFFNGESIRFPGDPGASAANVVNCRCSLALIARRDADGNLISRTRPVSMEALIGGAAIGALLGVAIGEAINNEI